MKDPIIPEIIATFKDNKIFGQTLRKYAEIPIIAAPTIPITVPSIDTPPSVPGGTFFKFVISLGFV